MLQLSQTLNLTKIMKHRKFFRDLQDLVSMRSVKHMSLGVRPCTQPNTGDHRKLQNCIVNPLVLYARYTFCGPWSKLLIGCPAKHMFTFELVHRSDITERHIEICIQSTCSLLK